MRTTYCCAPMAYHATKWCAEHPRRHECPDALIAEVHERLGTLVHDGGSAVIEIAHCPWCGTKLAAGQAAIPEEKRMPHAPTSVDVEQLRHVGADADGAPRWTVRRVTTAAFIIAFLTLQVLLPLALLPSSYRRIGIAQLGWQMYAHDHVPPVVVAHGPAGADTVPRRDLPLYWAVTLGYDQTVVRRLCAARPNAVRVSATTRHPTAPVTEWYTCAR